MQLLTLALYATCAAGGFLRRSGERLTPEAAVAEVEAAVAEVEAPEAEAVRKPKTDQRRYHHEVWSSGLSVLVVEDPNAQKSSYAMAVEVGSLEDPEDFQGLAHFCEHMVFLGSKKYPAEDQFSDRLAFYGGQNNAYTSADQTVYYAEVDDKGFDQTFDIFAQFFIEPTFSGNMVDREINAVDSEHKKNMPDIGRRLFHLMNSRGNPESPVSKFATGNLKTLKLDPEKAGKSLPQALRRFHQEHYCPSRMHLVIMRNASVAEQLKAAHRSFDVLGRKPCPARPVYDNVAAFSRATGTLGRRLLVHTDGAPQLWLMFPLVSLRGRYKALPEAYINYAMSHYGPGGLKALLKHEDLSLQYSTMTETTPAGTNLFVIFSLTEQGASKPEEVVEHFFAYFAALKAKGATKELLEKLQAMNQVLFDYQEPSASESSYVTQLAGALPSVRPEDVLTGGVLMDEINLTLTGQLLGAIRPQNLNLALATRSFDAKAARHEEYYDFNYTEEPLPEALVRRWASASSAALAAPPAPRFVPTALGLISAELRKVPEKLQSEPQLWWLGLGRFQLPKAQLQLKLGFDRSVVGTAARSALAAVHARLVKLALEEPSDAFQMCGLGYGVAAANDGLSVSFSGFNEHLVELVRLVLPVLRRPQISAADFEVARRQLILDLADVTGQQPYQHAMEALEVVTVKNTFSRAATLAAARDEWAVSLGELGVMLDEMFEEPKISMLVTGNIDQDESKQLMAEVQSILAPRRGLLGRLWLRFTHLLFDSSRGSAAYDPLVLDLQKELEVRVGNPIPKDPNSVTIAAYQFGVPSLADRVRFSLISGVIDRPVFQTLRTEHQLGYVVFGYATAHMDILEVRVLVQGFRESPDVVAQLIDSTVRNLTSAFSMKPAELEVRKATLRQELRKPPANLGDFAGRFWSQIWDETYCFDKVDKELKVLEGVTPQSLAEAWNRTTGSSKKLLVKLFGSDPTGDVKIPEARGKEVITELAGLNLDAAPRWPHKYLCE